jgi:hypothetical protein
MFPLITGKKTSLVLYVFVHHVDREKHAFLQRRILGPSLTATATSEPEKPSVFLAKSSKSFSDKLWGVSPR